MTRYYLSYFRLGIDMTNPKVHQARLDHLLPRMALRRGPLDLCALLPGSQRGNIDTCRTCHWELTVGTWWAPHHFHFLSSIRLFFTSYFLLPAKFKLENRNQYPFPSNSICQNVVLCISFLISFVFSVCLYLLEFLWIM